MYSGVELCEMIPHEGKMCLLDNVLDWNGQQIQCLATSHWSKSHPLRTASGLASVHGIEYGAQAMAVHGRLLSSQADQPTADSFIAASRDVNLYIDWLDRVSSPLEVSAEKIFIDNGNMIYKFVVRGDNQTLVEGRITVMKVVTLK